MKQHIELLVTGDGIDAIINRAIALAEVIDRLDECAMEVMDEIAEREEFVLLVRSLRSELTIAAAFMLHKSDKEFSKGEG